VRNRGREIFPTKHLTHTVHVILQKKNDRGAFSLLIVFQLLQKNKPDTEMPVANIRLPHVLIAMERTRWNPF
jgi:hypothetical protein